MALDERDGRRSAAACRSDVTLRRGATEAAGAAATECAVDTQGAANGATAAACFTGSVSVCFGAGLPGWPNGKKRPGDTLTNALYVAGVATDTAKQAGGKAGGAARAAALTPEQRSQIAKKAAAKRWAPVE